MRSQTDSIFRADIHTTNLPISKSSKDNSIGIVIHCYHWVMKVEVPFFDEKFTWTSFNFIHSNVSIPSSSKQAFTVVVILVPLNLLNSIKWVIKLFLCFNWTVAHFSILLFENYMYFLEVLIMQKYCQIICLMNNTVLWLVYDLFYDGRRGSGWEINIW